MPPGRVHDPEEAKHIVISYKTTEGTISAVDMHMYKIVNHVDPASGRLQVDQAAIAGGKQNMNLKGRRVLLIYKTAIHPESVITPEKCTTKADPMTRYRRIVNTASQLDQYQPDPGPENGHELDEDMMDNNQQLEQQSTTGTQPPSGSGACTTRTIPQTPQRVWEVPLPGKKNSLSRRWRDTRAQLTYSLENQS